MKYVCSIPKMNLAEILYVPLTYLYVNFFLTWQNEGGSLRFLDAFMLSTSFGSCFASLFQLILNHDALSFQLLLLK